MQSKLFYFVLPLKFAIDILKSFSLNRKGMCAPLRAADEMSRQSPNLEF